MSINSTVELRETISSVLDKVVSGDIMPTQANAVSNLIGKYLHTIKLEMEYHKIKDMRPSIKFLEPENKEPKKLEKEES